MMHGPWAPWQLEQPAHPHAQAVCLACREFGAFEIAGLPANSTQRISPLAGLKFDDHLMPLELLPRGLGSGDGVQHFHCSLGSKLHLEESCLLLKTVSTFLPDVKFLRELGNVQMFCTQLVFKLLPEILSKRVPLIESSLLLRFAICLLGVGKAACACHQVGGEPWAFAINSRFCIYFGQTRNRILELKIEQP